jgi:endoglucanase
MAVSGYNLFFRVVIAAMVFVGCDKAKGDNKNDDASPNVTPVSAENTAEQPAKAYYKPVEKYGKIKVALVDGKRQLCDERGSPVQLKGMSTMGLQWEGWALNEAAFDALAYDWQCDIIRLAMYVTETGYKDKPAERLADVEKGIKLATDRGMYVLVDWHILTPGNPASADYLNAGKDLPHYADIKAAHPDYTGPQLFFAYLSQKYGDQPNLLFETANEPNKLGSGSWQAVLLPYHQSVVDAIRAYDKDGLGDNIIICGTDSWSQEVDAPVGHEVVDAKGQIMYAVHFYAGTHEQWLRDRVTKALNGGIAVFCTEWGTSGADGGADGKVYLSKSDTWLDFFKANNVSWCNWSLARKQESSAAFTPGAAREPVDNDGNGKPDWLESQLSASGKYIRNRIREQ